MHVSMQKEFQFHCHTLYKHNWIFNVLCRKGSFLLGIQNAWKVYICVEQQLLISFWNRCLLKLMRTSNFCTTNILHVTDYSEHVFNSLYKEKKNQKKKHKKADKMPNEICSFLYDYLKKVPHKITKLWLFADNGSCQNKNNALYRFLMLLTDTGQFEKIIVFSSSKGPFYFSLQLGFCNNKAPYQHVW